MLSKALFAGMMLLLFWMAKPVSAQRTYTSASALATGTWYQFSVQEAGVYRIDVPFLGRLGINTSNIPAAAIRLYGNGGQMLPEHPTGNVWDDLRENAIEVVDGGDGVLDGADYILFYADGPDAWLPDATNRRFRHEKNIYTDRSFYFLTIGGTGKRITNAPLLPTAAITVTSYNDRYYHELDTVNFLSSGKDWFGEEFANTPGRTLTRSFPLPFSTISAGEPVTVVSRTIARSINAGSRFVFSLNGATLYTHELPGVTASNLELFASTSEKTASLPAAGNLLLSMAYQPGSTGSQGWLDWFEAHARRPLSMAASSQLLFRDWNSVSTSAAASFVVEGGQAGTRVWNVTDAAQPIHVPTVLQGATLRFQSDTRTLQEFVAFNPTGFRTPVALGKVPNQNLHGLKDVDMVIITHAPVLEQAQRLAAFHRQHDQLSSAIVTATQVYNEYASGSSDPTAIRDFMKMFYDRANGDSSRRPRYLLLFGDASFDPKSRLPGNLNAVPSYQSAASLDPLTTYVTDDYFGFLDDTEDINQAGSSNSLDIGIGRVTVKNSSEARSFVDKVIAYHDTATLGAWRNHLTFIADDEDFNLHLHDAETITAAADSTNPTFLADKIYLDAFPQQSNASGSRYPAVNQAIARAIQEGTLIWNYNGHGGFRRLAEEVVLNEEVVNGWRNANRLPLIITATCDFAPYDNPTITSLGENMLLRPTTGAIALMTTTRLVFAYSNRIMNQHYLEAALQRRSGGRYPSLGEAVRQAKNMTYQSRGDVVNALKFTLLGDPAMTLAFPTLQVRTTSINGVPVSAVPDTLRALQKYTIAGVITNAAGVPLDNFNGTVYPTLYDKPQNKSTLANDPGSLKETFQEQQNLLFKGKSVVKNGRFSIEFIVPADIRYPFGAGRLSYYAHNGSADANGVFTGLQVGGSVQSNGDQAGPVIRALLENGQFIDGGTVGDQPLLIVHLADSSGINVSTTGIGHQILATLDGDPSKTFALNDVFESDLDSYRSGSVRFSLPLLTEGQHTLTIKAWDVANNSSQVTISFRVVKAKTISISRLVNFPNPFRNGTTFRFYHELPQQEVLVSLRIFTAAGALVKTIQRTINTGGNRSCDIEWDGRSDLQSRMKPGNYFYMLRVSASSGAKGERSGTLVVF